MTFEIIRTSTLYKKVPPCKNAYAKDVLVFIKRNYIRDEQGNRIMQETPLFDKRWFVDINTLEELIAIREEVENPLIIDHDDELNRDVIEIYDSYRE